MDYTIDNWIQLKKEMCEGLILSRYSERDQINIIARWTQEEKDEMNAYIGWILDEYRTNGADADFSQYMTS